MPLVVKTLGPAWKAYQLEKKAKAQANELFQYGVEELKSYRAATGFKKRIGFTARCVICKHAKSYGLTMFAAPSDLHCAKKGMSCREANTNGECEPFAPISRLAYSCRRVAAIIPPMR